MFAVPGWKLSASKPVLEQLKPSKNKTQGKKDSKIPSSSKKRKRDGDISHAEEIEPNAAKTNEDRQATNTSKKHQEDRESSDHKVKKQSSSKQDVTELAFTDFQAESLKDVRKEKASGNTKEASRRSGDRKQDAEGRDESQTQRATTSASSSLATIPPPPPPATSLTPLQAKMRNKLTSARFRHLNETLYTTNSTEALQLFTSSPDLFAEYHAGFSQQVKDSWPQNPVSVYIQAIKSRGVLRQSQDGLVPLPRRKTGSCTIADLGCGDAPLARGCQSVTKKLILKFHNYDLHAPNTFVTKADISNLPLQDGEADIAVFCLSLMGTNWISFVEEVWRILRGDGKGEVWVAEVKSRFGRAMKGRVVENSVGKKRKKSRPQLPAEDDFDEGEQQFVEDTRTTDQTDDETDISGFVGVFQRRGFVLRENSVNKSNKMFVSMIFVKSGVPAAGKHKGMKWNGKEYQRAEDKKVNRPRFVGGQKGDEVDEQMSPTEEAKVLKPCVYKTR